jgi:hypothetical protein
MALQASVDWFQYVIDTLDTGSENSRGIGVDSQGNVYVGGTTNLSTVNGLIFNGRGGGSITTTKIDSNTTQSAFVVKYSSDGAIQWVTQIAGIGSNGDFVFDIDVDSSDNIYVLGQAQTDIKILATPTTSISFPTTYATPTNTTTATFIAKYDPNGTFKWISFINGDGDEKGVGLTVRGNKVYANVCQFSATTRLRYMNNSAFDITVTNPDAGGTNTNKVALLAQFTTDGIPQWGAVVSSSSALDDEGRSSTTDASGNVYFAGYVGAGSVTLVGPGHNLTVTKPTNSANIGGFVTKYNESGNLLWTLWMDGLGSEKNFGITSDDTNIYVTGDTTSSTMTISGPVSSGVFNKTSFGKGAYVVKINQSGEVQWVQWIDGVGTESALGISANKSGYVVATGTSTGSSSISIQGQTYNKPYSTSNTAAYITEFDTNGNLQWFEWFDVNSTTSMTQLYTAKILDNNVIYTNGIVTPTSVIAEGYTYTKPRTTTEGAYLVKLVQKPAVESLPSTITVSNAALNNVANSSYLSWVQWIDGTGEDQGLGITTDSSGNVYAAGFVGTGTVIIGGRSYTKPSNAADPGAYIVKYNITGAVQWVQWIDGSGIDQVRGISTDSSGNVYATGIVATGTVTISGQSYTKPSNAADQGAYIVKYNTAGAVQWVQWIDGIGTDQGSRIATDSVGNVYASGIVATGTVTISGQSYIKPSNAADQGAYIVKYNTNGAVQWVQWVDGTGADIGWGIATDSSGNVYATGFVGSGTVTISGQSYTKPSNATDQGAYIVKYNTAGAVQWVQWIDGDAADQGTGIITDSLGNVYATGFVFTGTVTISGQSYIKSSNAADAGAYIVKYTTIGAVQWVQWVDRTNNDQGFGITTDSVGNVYATGYGGSGIVTISGQSYIKPSNAANDGAYIVKYNTNGAVQWVQWVDGTGADNGRGIATDSLGNVYATGFVGSGTVIIGRQSYTKPTNTTDQGAYIVKFSQEYNPSIILDISSVTKNIGDVFSVTPTSSINTPFIFSSTNTDIATVNSSGVITVVGQGTVGIVVTQKGYTNVGYINSTAILEINIPVSSELSSIQWVQWIDGTGTDYGYGIATDSLGNVYATGYAGSGPVTISGQSYTKPFIGPGAYIVKYNTEGAVQWVQWVDGAGTDYGYGIATDSLGNVYATGFVGTGTVTIGGQSYTKPSNAADNGAYIVKYNTTGDVQWVQWVDGVGGDQGMGIATDSLGNVYATGYVATATVTIGGQSYTKPTNSGDVGLYIVKYNTEGAVQWVQWIDGPGTDQGLGIATDSLGNVYATGYVGSLTARITDASYTKQFGADLGAYIVKYNSIGAIQWVQWIDGNNSEQGQSIATDSLGNVYTTGYANTATVTIGGKTYTKPSNATTMGAYIVKYNTVGAVKWVRWIDGASDDAGFGIATDSLGNVYTTGFVNTGTVTIGGQSYTKPSNLTNNGAYIVKYNNNGVVQYVEWVDGTGADRGQGIAADSLGNAYAIGYVGTGVVTIGGQSYTKPSNAGNNGAYIVKIGGVQRITATIQPLPNLIKAMGDAPFIVNPSSNSTGAFSYSSSAPAVATVDASGTITIISTGIATITISQAQTAGYKAASTTFSVSVLGVPTIMPLEDISGIVGVTPIYQTPTPTSNSTGAFSYSSSSPTIATVDATGAITFVGAGIATITVSQAQTAGYSSASITFSVSVFDVPTIMPLADVSGVVGVTPVYQIPAPTSNSTGAFTYSSSAPEVVTVDTTGAITFVGAGASTITVSQDASGVFFADSKTFTATVFLSPTIDAMPSYTKIYGDAVFQFAAPSSTSTGDFTYSSSNATVAAVDSNRNITVGLLGTATITAIQAAAGDYVAGSKTFTVTVIKATPIITTEPYTIAYQDPVFTFPQPTSDSNGTFTYTSSNPEVATVNNSRGITAVTTGTTTITVTQAESADYNSATATFTVTVERKVLAINSYVDVSQNTLSTYVIPQATSNVSGVQYTYTISNAAMAIQSPTNSRSLTLRRAGALTVTVAATETSNYTADSKTFVINITRRANALQAKQNSVTFPYLNPLSEVSVFLYAYSGDSTSLNSRKIFPYSTRNTYNTTADAALYGQIVDVANPYEYTILNENLATINVSGVISPLNLGTTKLIITQDEDDFYEAAIIEYNFGVTVYRPQVRDVSYTLKTVILTQQNPGTPVSDLLNTVIANKPVSSFIESYQGIAISSITNTNGTWQYKLFGGEFINIPAVSSANILVLDASATIRFVPSITSNYISSIMFRAWDRSDKAAPGTLNTGAALSYSSPATERQARLLVLENDTYTIASTYRLFTIVNNIRDVLNITNTVSSILPSLITITGVADITSYFGIAITSITPSNAGTLQYKQTATTTWINAQTLMDTSALLLDKQYEFRFVPDQGFSGDLSFNIKLWKDPFAVTSRYYNVAADPVPFSSQSIVGQQRILGARMTIQDAVNEIDETTTKANIFVASYADKRTDKTAAQVFLDIAAKIKETANTTIKTNISTAMRVGLKPRTGPEVTNVSGAQIITLDQTLFNSFQNVLRESVQDISAKTVKVVLPDFTAGKPAINMNQFNTEYVKFEINSGEVISIGVDGVYIDATYREINSIPYLTISGQNYTTGDMYSVGSRKFRVVGFGSIAIEPLYPPNVDSSAIVFMPSIAMDYKTLQTMSVADIKTSLGASYSDESVAAQFGIAVTGIPSAAYGRFQYAISGNWLDISSVSSTNALLLDTASTLRFVPATVNTVNTLTFKIWDKTDNKIAGQYANATYTVSGAYSQNSAQLVQVVCDSLGIKTVLQSMNVAARTGGYNYDTFFATLINKVVTSTSPLIQYLGGLTAQNSTSTVIKNFLPTINNGAAVTLASTTYMFDIFTDSSANEINVGRSVQYLLSGLDASFSATNTANFVQPAGIIITSISGQGTLQYKPTGGNWTSISFAGGNTIPLEVTTMVRFIPATNYKGVAGFYFRAWNTFGSTTAAPATLAVMPAASYSSGESFARFNNIPLIIRDLDNPDILLFRLTANLVPKTSATVREIITSMTSNYVEYDMIDPKGIAIIDLCQNVKTGFWQYSLDNIIYSDISTVSQTSALLLDPSAAIRFIPADNTIDASVNIVFKAWDGTSGTAGQKVNITTNDKGSFSTNTQNAIIKIDPYFGIPVNIMLPIQVDFNQFGDITVRVEGENVAYTYDLLLSYNTSGGDVTAQQLCNAIQYRQDLSSDAYIDVSCISNNVLNSLFTNAIVSNKLDISSEKFDVSHFVYDPSNTMTPRAGPGSLKEYITQWLYVYLYDIIGLAATTGYIDISMAKYGEDIPNNLVSQFTANTVSSIAIREFVYKSIFAQDPVRFKTDISQNFDNVYAPLPFRVGDSLSVLIKFSFPKANIVAPVEQTVMRENGQITGGAATNITVSTSQPLNIPFRAFRDLRVWFKINLGV